MRKNLLITTTIIIAVTLSSCERWRCIEGNGRTISKSFSFTNFTEVVSYGDFDVFIEQNDSNYFSVDVDADENFMPYLLISKRNNRLEIKTENNRCFKEGDRISVFIKMPQILYAELAGSGHMDINCNQYYNDSQTAVTSGSGEIDMYGIYAGTLETKISGSGLITLQGQTDEHDLEISGSGDVKSYDLDSNTCYVDIPGSGYAQVFVYDYLDINIPGSGNVYYKGNPNVKYRITGSGAVYNRN